MRGYLVLCIIAFVAITSADFSLDIINSTENYVLFEYDCWNNGACKEPGEEYCGEGEIKSLMCIDGDECEVECMPLQTIGTGKSWEAKFTINPTKKKVGKDIEFRATEIATGDSLICDIDIYFGGRWKTEEVEGSTHWGKTLAIVTDTSYLNGTLLESVHTDRRGDLTFVPDKPGRYVLRALNKYLVFIVGDESGNEYNCSNDICETDLGEDKTICPQDCVKEPEIIEENDTDLGNFEMCGNGRCEGGEDEATCPEDCKEEVIFTDVCGDGICGDSEECDEDCKKESSEFVIDNSMILIGLAIIVILTFVFLVKTGKLKRAKKLPAPIVPKICSKCGTSVPNNRDYCVKCGSLV